MMSFQKLIFFSLFLFVASGVAFSQEAAKTNPDEINRASLNELRAQGFEAMYNLEYEEARHRFKEMTRISPDHPVGPQCLAASIWLQQLNQSRSLQASLYSTKSFAAKNKDQVDPRTVEEFRRWTQQAELLAEARLRRNPRDVEALYFLGATEGLKAVFAAAIERRFVAALRNGSRSVERHREVLKLDPNFHDARLTIGMYDYIVGWLPLPVKVLASVGGVRGSKRRGVETLERVAKEGEWARDIARLLLIDLYKREARWAEALAVTRELSTKYPRNYLFKLQTADALMRQAAALRQPKGPSKRHSTEPPGHPEDASDTAASVQEREALSIFEWLLSDRSTSGTATARASDLIHFRYGEALLAAGQPEPAAREFLAAASVSSVEAGLATMAHLRAAQAMDLIGKRGAALAQYQVVLARSNVHDAHQEARHGLREPYREVIRTHK